jgi:hypothetical protein
LCCAAIRCALVLARSEESESESLSEESESESSSDSDSSELELLDFAATSGLAVVATLGPAFGASGIVGAPLASCKSDNAQQTIRKGKPFVGTVFVAAWGVDVDFDAGLATGAA